MISFLARIFKVRCPDCGYYPYERGLPAPRGTQKQTLKDVERFN
jgi:hypothetical protein